MTIERLIEEVRRVVITTLYLFVCFSAVLFYKMSVLHAYGIAFAPFGLAAIKALVLGKFVLLGRAAHIGDRYKNNPLIYPVLHQSLLFLVMLIALSFAEEVIKGHFQGEAFVDVLEDIGGWVQIAAVAVLLWLVLLPYFGVIRLAEVMGEGRLREIIWGRYESVHPDQAKH